MTQDPDDNDAYSGYRPDMDQYREHEPVPRMEWKWPMTVAVIFGTIFWILLGLWIFT